MKLKEYKVHLIQSKCTPKWTLMIFNVNHLSIKMKKKSENACHSEHLYTLLSISYKKVLMTIADNIVTKKGGLKYLYYAENNFEFFAKPLLTLRFILSFWTILPKYPNFGN